MRNLADIEKDLHAAESAAHRAQARANALRREWLKAKHSVPGAPAHNELAQAHVKATADQWLDHYGQLTYLTKLYHERLSQLGC